MSMSYPFISELPYESRAVYEVDHFVKIYTWYYDVTTDPGPITRVKWFSKLHIFMYVSTPRVDILAVFYYVQKFVYIIS